MILRDREWRGHGFPVSPNLHDMLVGEDKTVLVAFKMNARGKPRA
jgi:hypothetical protein